MLGKTRGPFYVVKPHNISFCAGLRVIHLHDWPGVPLKVVEQPKASQTRCYAGWGVTRTFLLPRTVESNKYKGIL